MHTNSISWLYSLPISPTPPRFTYHPLPNPMLISFFLITYWVQFVLSMYSKVWDHHWVMVDMPGATPLEKSDFSTRRIHELSKASARGGGPWGSATSWSIDWLHPLLANTAAENSWVQESCVQKYLLCSGFPWPLALKIVLLHLLRWPLSFRRRKWV